LIIKENIFENFRHHLFRSHLFAYHSTRFSATHFYAATTLCTKLPDSDKGAVYPANRIVFAGSEALAAPNASILSENDLFERRDGLRIVTPLAAKRTTFEEDCRADTWSIIDRVSHDIKNHAFHFRSVTTATAPCSY